MSNIRRSCLGDELAAFANIDEDGQPSRVYTIFSMREDEANSGEYDSTTRNTIYKDMDNLLYHMVFLAEETTSATCLMDERGTPIVLDNGDDPEESFTFFQFGRKP